ncbi:MAG: CvpA family protein [bacterium]
MANWIDVVAVIAVAAFVFYGMQRGVMRTFLDIFAVLFAIFFSGQFYRVLSTSVMPFLRVQDASVYAVTFIVFWVIVFAMLELLVGFIMKLVKISFIGVMEALGGALLGLIQGILIVGIAIQICLMFPLPSNINNLFSTSISKKISMPTLTKSYLSVFGVFPKIDFIQQGLQTIEEKIIPVIPSKEKIPYTKKTKKPRL